MRHRESFQRRNVEALERMTGMSNDGSPSFDSFDDEDIPSVPSNLSQEPTQSIDLASLFDPEVSESGSFDLSLVRSSALGKILDAIPVPALLIDCSFHVTFANEACTRPNKQSTDLLGRPFAELVPRRQNAEKALMLLQRALKTRKPQVSEAVLNIDGRKIWGRVHLRSVRIGPDRQVLLLIEDLTHEKTQLVLKKRHEEEIRRAWAELENLVKQRTQELARMNQRLRGEIEKHRRTQEQLAQESRKFFLLAEHSPLGMAMLDRDDAIQYINPKFQSLFGYGPHDCASGAELLKTIHHDLELANSGVAQWFERKRAGSTKESVFRERTGRCRDGTEKHVDVELVDLGNGDVLVTWEDVTAKREAQMMLLKTARLNALVEMASGVAHNFNNLLQMIIGSAEEALVSLDSEALFEAKTSINHILKEASLGMDTVKRLQTFAGADYHEETGITEVLDLSDLVAQAIEMTSPWWKNAAEKAGAGITFSRKLAEGCIVRGNRGQLFEMAVNLIKNATEALPRGGLIEVTTSVSDNWVVLAVKDDGVGISEENLTKVFEPFWTTKGEQGTGIGLASAFGIAKAHLGSITAESQEGSGAKFTVKLPLCTELPAAVESSEGLHPDKKLSVLVVDDVQSIVELLESGLGRLGHVVYPAFSGTEALEAFQREKIDLVICDLGMPHMNGWQVAEAIQEISLTRGDERVPFVLMTGWGRSQELKPDFMHSSAVDRVLTKPLSLVDLVSTIRELKIV